MLCRQSTVPRCMIFIPISCMGRKHAPKDTDLLSQPIRGNGYRFVHKGGTFPTENHHACCEKLRFVEALTQTCTKWDKICTTAC